ncbi:MAG TPA: saccharopine dehydrogenase NADP-binding domain-containing protein [Nocardioidaceae bacterium]|nr:saccharopine dehydrogenase NADP-binding domain-containing protein [Nocardioidaceae bacterium]
MPDQEFDIVLFGATGFTGGLTAEYLAQNAPTGCRWALAGRSQAKLEAVRDRLVKLNPALAELPLLTAEIGDAPSLRRVAEAAKVVITTVGPYLNYGEPLVAACAAAGTDYVDLTGEPQFVDDMYLKYHDQAVATGARIVHACGFDSIPHDLGAYFTVQQLPGGAPIKMRGVVRAGGMFSGGTFHSAITQMSSMRESMKIAAARKKKEPRPADRKVRGDGGRPRRDGRLGLWIAPMPTIDPQIVLRSARALPAYGPEFTYGHYAGLKRLTTVAGAGVGIGALVGAAQVPPLRKLLLSRVPQGEGPSEAKRARSWFKVIFIAESGDRTVQTEVSGGDPGYGETAKMLAESAMCLAFDENPETSGQVTTAQAMGENLIDRLVKAGISFTVTHDE